jgi:hypothetical protein
VANELLEEPDEIFHGQPPARTAFCECAPPSLGVVRRFKYRGCYIIVVIVVVRAAGLDDAAVSLPRFGAGRRGAVSCRWKGHAQRHAKAGGSSARTWSRSTGRPIVGIVGGVVDDELFLAVPAIQHDVHLWRSRVAHADSIVEAVAFDRRPVSAPQVVAFHAAAATQRGSLIGWTGR